MRDFGMCLLGKSIVDATFAEMQNPYGHAIGAMTCANAAEIIIKARIAEEHPLLIFNKLPKPTAKDGGLLGIDSLFYEGRTLMYGELPDALWATTGYRIKNLKQFKDFGKIRNNITHLGVPGLNLSKETLRFAFQVMNPMIIDFWKSDIFDSICEYDPDAEEYVREQLKGYKIKSG